MTSPPEVAGRPSPNNDTISLFERQNVITKIRATVGPLAIGGSHYDAARYPELVAMVRLHRQGFSEEYDEPQQSRMKKHLLRIVVLWLGGYLPVGAEIARKSKLFDDIHEPLEAEIDELRAVEDLQDMPDVWDSAYADLLDLEGWTYR